MNSVLLASVVCKLVRVCGRHRRQLINIAFTSLGPFLFGGVEQLLIVMLFYVNLAVIINVIVKVLIMTSPFALLLAVPLLVTYTIPLTLFAPVCLFRRVNVLTTF